MCGFFGVHCLTRTGVTKGIDAVGARDVMRHRGPDDQGYFEDDTTYFGFNRLSIIDLSSSGRQPMSSKDGTLHLVFNGEIFNYMELRDELKHRGHSFISTGDSEVIIHAYEEYGTEFLNKLNGMWGFALYDSGRNRLFCSRDRFGIKPFYYHIDDKRIIFASEIKAIIRAGVRTEPDDRSVFRYLAYGQLDTDQNTMFRGIHQLPPAHFLMVEQGRVRIGRFWNVDEGQNRLDRRVSYEEVLEQFRELFFSAIELRLRSDVQVGALLSGGLDSSAIVSAIHHIGAGRRYRIRTFTAAYPERAIDESAYAREVVQETGFENVIVYPGEDHCLSDEIEKVIYHQDEPPLTMTVFAHWYLMREIARHDIKVILSGQGADEMFAGYIEQFCGYFLRDLMFYGEFKKFFSELSMLRQRSGLSVATLLIQFIKAMMSRNVALLFKTLVRERAIQNLDQAFVRQYWKWSGAEAGVELRRGSSLNRKLFRAFSVESLPRILHYEDRNSMAFSIEQRMPFLDYRLVEFAYSLANCWKMDSGIGKIIIRRGLSDVMPSSIVNRFSKLGFTVPQNRWINEMKAYLSDLFSSQSFRNRPYWDTDRIVRIYERNRRCLLGMDVFLWRVIACEIWMSVFFS